MKTPKPVRVLPEIIANQIAAGEVVERPASVVKELVENAIDAGATRIEVDLVAGGAKRITIHDNGSGMTREDAINALERQATSKIQTTEDITMIDTMGFRGEAIPSIASVSRFTLKTRTADAETATELHVVGGHLEDISETGTPIGTTVEVCDLFFNLPARKKFLKSASTELARIRTLLMHIALANPTIAFILHVDGREIYRLPENDTLTDRIAGLLGEAIIDELLPIDYSYHGIHVTGFVMRPARRIGTLNTEQFIFINGRPATAPIVQYAIREATPTQEGSRKQGIFLFINLPPQEIDVNVHPTKREVRFRTTYDVSTAIMAAITQAYSGEAEQATLPPPTSSNASAACTPSNPGTRGETSASYCPGSVAGCEATATANCGDSDGSAPLSPIGHLPTPQAPTPKQGLLAFSQTRPYPGAQQFPQSRQNPFTSSPGQTASIKQEGSLVLKATVDSLQPLECNSSTNLWRWFKVVEILDQGYILITTDQGYVTIDALAATERIIYEHLLNQPDTPAIQPLLIPETIKLPPNDADRIKRFLPQLHEIGFSLSELSQDTFMLESLPQALSNETPVELIIQLAADLAKTTTKRTRVEQSLRQVVVQAAAQATSGTATHHTPHSAHTLVQALSQTDLPYTSPRGRATMILTTYQELNRRFQR